MNYAIGVVSGAYWRAGLTPSREVLELAALCQSVYAAAQLADPKWCQKT